jgi:pimeloyl-ACP methyl ester carboxylesterase
MLQQQLPGLRFHWLDLPGCGEHYRQLSPLSISNIRQHLQRQCRDKYIQPPFGVIGLSLGGMVALEWLAASIDVAAVVLINSSANDFPLFCRIRPGAAARAVQAMLSTMGTRERLILTMVSNRFTSDSTVLEYWQAIQQQQPVSRSLFFRQLIAAARFKLPDLGLHKQGLVLASHNDRMVACDCSRKLADRYHWPLRLHPEAGHDLPLDQPEWVIAAFKQWLLGTSGS